MKNIKKALIFISSLALFNLSLSASSLPPKNSNPVFEFYNKDKNTIHIKILYKSTQGKMVRFGFSLSSGKQGTSLLDQDLDINKPCMIQVISGENSTFYEINAPGKTKYLTWNPAKNPSLYPQTGPLMGFLGKTESGLPLKNNIKSSDIKEVTRFKWNEQMINNQNKN